MKKEIGIGSVAISKKNHLFLTSLVENSNSEITENKPFTSIVEAYRFAFAVGYSNNKKKKEKGSKETIAPRQFVVNEYLDILEKECRDLDATLGNIVTQYSEAGANILFDKLESGQLISTLFKSTLN